jgi:hypothetical protein
MHKLRPTAGQVEAAIDRIAETNLPETERRAFRDRMMTAIDIQKLDDISIKAMAEVFTVPELQKMIEYYSTPESRSAAQKMPIYQNMVQPEISKMLDAALLELRTGKPADH